MQTQAGLTPTGPRALDNNLAFLASKAALELDSRRRRPNEQSNAAMRLGEMLKKRVSGQSTGPLNPITANLFGGHFGPPAGDDRSAQGAKDWTNAFAARLLAVGGETPNEELQQLRDLCVALAQRAQAEMEYGRNARLVSRFRK